MYLHSFIKTSRVTSQSISILSVSLGEYLTISLELNTTFTKCKIIKFLESQHDNPNYFLGAVAKVYLPSLVLVEALMKTFQEIAKVKEIVHQKWKN